MIKNDLYIILLTIFFARVIASVVPSNENSKQHLILFDNPDLATSYTQLVQHLITINNIANVVIPKKRNNCPHYRLTKKRR